MREEAGVLQRGDHEANFTLGDAFADVLLDVLVIDIDRERDDAVRGDVLTRCDGIDLPDREGVGLEGHEGADTRRAARDVVGDIPGGSECVEVDGEGVADFPRDPGAPRAVLEEQGLREAVAVANAEELDRAPEIGVGDGARRARFSVGGEGVGGGVVAEVVVVVHGDRDDRLGDD